VLGYPCGGTAAVIINIFFFQKFGEENYLKMAEIGNGRLNGIKDSEFPLNTAL